MKKQKPIDKQRVSDHVANKVAGHPAFDSEARDVRTKDVAEFLEREGVDSLPSQKLAQTSDRSLVKIGGHIFQVTSGNVRAKALWPEWGLDALAEMSSNPSLDGIEEIAAQAKNRIEKSDSLRSRVPGAVELLEAEG